MPEWLQAFLFLVGLFGGAVLLGVWAGSPGLMWRAIMEYLIGAFILVVGSIGMIMILAWLLAMLIKYSK